MRPFLLFALLAACTVTAGDVALSAHADTYTTPWDAVLTVNAPGLLVNDTAPEGDQLVTFLAQAPAVGTLSLNEDGSFSYEPVDGTQGPVTFVYGIEDQNGETSFATARIDVTAGNKAPLGIDNYYTVKVPNSLSVTEANGVLANDLDLDGDDLSAELVEAPTVGALELNANGSFTYHVDPVDSGRYQFRYRVVDTHGASAEATAFVSLVSRNLPVAAPDTANALLGRETTIDVLANDHDPDGNALRVVSVGGGDDDGAQVRVVNDARIGFLAEDGAARRVTLSYTVSDGIHEVSSTVEVNVVETDAAPVAVNDYFALAPGTSVTFNPADNDHDPNGLSLSRIAFYRIHEGTRFGSLTRDGETGTVADRYTYTAGSEAGTEVLAYIISNGFRIAYGQVTLKVTGLNAPPVVENEAITVPLRRIVPFLDVLANDYDPNNDPLSIARVTVQGGSAGSLSLLVVDQNRGLSLQPWRAGVYLVTYWVTDGIDETPGQVAITVPGPTENVARDDAYTITEGTSMALNVFDNDVYLERNRYIPPDFNPSGLRGSLAWANGYFSYFAVRGFVGETSFSYTLPGDKTATVTITVLPANP